MKELKKVTFQKPDLPKLSKHFVVVDMHFHTKYSDGINSVKSIIKKAKKLGIGVAITDHNEIKGAMELSKYKSILSIPGIEVTAKEGCHILVYFYDSKKLAEFYKKYIKPALGDDLMNPLKLNVEEIINFARKYNTVIIFAHPYSIAYTGIFKNHYHDEKIEEIIKKVDGFEGINSENVHKLNIKAALAGFNYNKSIIAGSDGHTLYHLGRAVTYANCKKTRKAFLDSIKENKVKVIGKEIDILRKITSNSIKLKTTLKNYPDIIEKGIKHSYHIFKTKRKKIGENVTKIKHKIREKILKKRKK